MEPERLSLKEIMRYFLDFRHELTTKRLNYDLKLLKARLHILKAFEVLYDDLDTAIKMIRKAQSREDAADEAQKTFQARRRTGKGHPRDAAVTSSWASRSTAS